MGRHQDDTNATAECRGWSYNDGSASGSSASELHGTGRDTAAQLSVTSFTLLYTLLYKKLSIP